MRFYINGPKNGGDGVYDLIHEDGECLASHVCSHRWFAPGDLILQRPERLEELTEKFGPLDPIELVWLGDVSQGERNELLRKNHALRDAAEASWLDGRCRGRG